MTDTASKSAAAPAGPADLIEIFYSPKAVFERRRDGAFGLPYVAFVVLGIGIFFATRNLLQPVVDAEISRNIADAVAKNNIPPDRIAAMKSTAATVAAVGPVIVNIVWPFVIAIFVWIVGKLAKVPAISAVAIMIAVFSLYPKLVGAIVGAVLAAIRPESSLTSVAAISVSPAALLGPSASPALAGLLGRFDLFILWGVLLIAIGAEAAGRATRAQAWVTAGGCWLIGSILPLVRFFTS